MLRILPHQWDPIKWTEPLELLLFHKALPPSRPPPVSFEKPRPFTEGTACWHRLPGPWLASLPHTAGYSPPPLAVALSSMQPAPGSPCCSCNLFPHTCALHSAPDCCVIPGKHLTSLNLSPSALPGLGWSGGGSICISSVQLGLREGLHRCVFMDDWWKKDEPHPDTVH